MGPKTLRRLAVAAVALVLGVVAIVALQRYQVARLGKSNLVKAEEAEKAGDLAKAEELYLQHVRVFPEDFDAQVRFAGVLLERSRTPARMGQAMQIYKDVLTRDPGRADVRRSLARLQVESMGEKGDSQLARDARANLTVLRRNAPNDGDLAYLMGRCLQADGQDRDALKAYEEAVAKRSNDRFDARQRMAALYRGETLNSPADADRVVDEMVKEEPNDFRTHLARGRYRLRLLKPDEDPSAAEADFQEAIRLAPAEAEAYLELSQLKARRTPPDFAGAEEILAKGLKAAPKSGRLHLASAMLRLNANDGDGGLKALRQGLEALPDDASLRVTLADALAARGATTELRDQAQELYRIGLKAYGDFYAAFALVNAREWSEAKKVLLDKLVPLDLSSNDALRAGVNRLLARCYGNLGDHERQRSYLAGAVRDAPGDLASRLSWINGLVEQGETDRAIDEYRSLAESTPAVRPPLAALLIERNERTEVARRDWKEVEALIPRIAGDDPSSSLPVILTAKMKTAQGLRDEAVALLDAARAKGPKDRAAAQIWINSADLKAGRRDFAGAMKLLDEAKASLGDSRDLRLARLKYILVRGGADSVADLVATSKDLDALPVDQRVSVLDSVGAALSARGAPAEAREAWGRAAELAPNDVRPRLQSLGLLLDAKADIPAAEVQRIQTEADKLIADVRRIEGPDGYMARLAEIEFLTWRLSHVTDAAEKAKLRGDARAALGELRSRRPDWSVIPLATARLDELELDQAKDDDDRRRRIGRMADLYRQAVEMGQHSLPVIRRATELLMEAGRTAEVSQLWSKVPALGGETGDASNIEKSILQRVIGEKNFQDAETIVRQRIAARPNDFAERAILVQILIWGKKFQEAETELRQAVAADAADPDRRILLTEFLVATNKINEAEQAFAQIERAVGPEKAPRTMAACADLIAQGCQATGRDADKAKWITIAKDAHGKAQAAKPDDFSFRRAYVEFLLRMDLVDDVEAELTAILKPPADPARGVDPADLAWARRTLALTHVARSELSGDYQQAIKALYLYAPPDKPLEKLPEEVEDLRILARVYAAQRIVSYRTKAAEILKKLVDEQRASEDDRYLLARIYKADGDWDKARTALRDLVREERRPASTRELTQQVGRLTYFASELIDHLGSPPNDAEVTETQALIDRLKAFQPDAFNVLALQARLDKARGKEAEALAAIKAIADQPKVPPVLARALGGLAEKIGLYDEAEAILKRNATASPQLDDQLEYAVYLGRRGRIKDALDVCEPIWNSSPNPAPATPAVLSILLSEQSYHDPEQIARVSGWIERVLQRTPDSPMLVIALGTIRDRQERYPEAMELYRKVLAKNASEIVPLNNLAWLMTLQGDKGADPLKLINRAIQLRGPVPELLDTRAVVYLTNGDFNRAIKDLEDAVAIDSGPSRYFHLARAQLAAGDQEAARRSFAKARDTGLKDADVHPLERPALAQVEKALK